MLIFSISIFVIICIIIIIIACSTENKEREKDKLYNRFYFDNEFEDFMFREDSFDDDFGENYTDEFATNDLKKSYFTKNISDDYNSYYTQIHYAAKMNDEESTQEMKDEFGNDWENEF